MVSILATNLSGIKALHRGCLLNDNLDGTMSVVGQRKIPDPISGRMPPIVVSRRPIDPTTAPPKAAPRRPGRRRKTESCVEHDGVTRPKGSNGKWKGKRIFSHHSDASSDNLLSPSMVSVPVPVTKDVTGKDRRPLTPRSLSSTGTLDEKSPGSAFWEYLTMYLPPDTQYPENPHLLELLSLDRKRDLPHRWRVQLLSGHPTVKTLCAVLAYLTGTQADPPCGTCVRLNKVQVQKFETGPNSVPPFPSCIRVPELASIGLKEFFGDGVCCNEFYVRSEGQEETSEFLPLNDQARNADIQTPDRSRSSQSRRGENEPDNSTDSENDNDSEDIIVFSPSTVHGSPAYKTAVPVPIAGRPRVVSIRRASGGTGNGIQANNKTKRRSSIRRLAAKLGTKAARREAAVYKPREKTVPESNEQAESTGVPQMACGDLAGCASFS
jgi:hypothetical protein